jgi:hypothetical protein
MISDLEFVKEYWCNIKFVENKTYELCLEAVKRNHYALLFIPDQLITYELCLISVEKAASCIQYVPERFQTNEICLKVIKDNPLYICHIKNITDEMWKTAIAIDPKLFFKNRNPSQEVIDFYELLKI